MTTATPHLLQGYGLELEYMIVQRESLDVLPVADRLLALAVGAPERIINDVERDGFAWSNELTMHVVEMKTNGPAPSLSGLAEGFQAEARAMNQLLASLDARLMPGAMHPWMHPFSETRLWPHGYRRIYQAYNRIFNCQGHGWSNLQSTHLNLAFHGDEEFGRLHAAIRLILPLIPALAASSPFVEGQARGPLDNRLVFYRQNQAKILSIAGQIIPEAVYTRADYERVILERNYEDIAPFDPKGVLQEEWLNSRGAIARFQRSAIEIRLIDIQECPAADLAIVSLLSSVISALIAEQWSPLAEQQAMPIPPLVAALNEAIVNGERGVIRDPAYLRLLGIEEGPLPLGELCRRLAAKTVPDDDPGRKALTIILNQGPLARRLLAAAGPRPDRARMREVYGRLADCLEAGEMFVA
ncbi:MAG: glutamate-cysteine ligase family protein [Desulfobacteraceae bacterium]|nr:glutamate-cysteine ligase family protein [Desulfobacteraceae bacterium]